MTLGVGCLSTPDPKPLPEGWLRVEDGRIRLPDGAPFRGRGASVTDTRGCNACAYNPPVPAEVERRIDELVDVWGGNFVRLLMESYAEADGRIQYENALDDPNYLADLERVVAHTAGKPGVYVALSMWIDPTLTSDGWPSTETRAVWRRLAEAFVDAPNVMYEIVQAPESNADGSQNEALWTALDDTVAAIREVEEAAGAPPHVILVPGMQQAGSLDYFIDHPIQAGDGRAIAYHVAVVDGPDSFDSRFATPAASLPVVVSMFGPTGDMTLADCDSLMGAAEAADVPWLAWSFHMRCPPNLLVDNSTEGCGVDMALQPTEWGQHVRDRLAVAW